MLFIIANKMGHDQASHKCTTLRCCKSCQRKLNDIDVVKYHKNEILNIT